MLVNFDSKVGALTMFGDVAVQLLKLMGHSGTVPSAILAPDIPAALDRLKRALDQGASLPPAPPTRRTGARDARRYPCVSAPTRSSTCSSAPPRTTPT